MRIWEKLEDFYKLFREFVVSELTVIILWNHGLSFLVFSSKTKSLYFSKVFSLESYGIASVCC